MRFQPAFLFLFFALLPSFALAAGPGASYFEGVLHTLLGLDHLIAMIAVGLISSQIGRRAIWQVPFIFVLTLVIGGAAGLTLTEGALRRWLLSSSESVIMLSDLILVLGVIWVSPRRQDFHAFSLLGLFVIVFGLFHGFAHGGEIPPGAAPLFYVLGFATTSTLMHILGVLLGEVGRSFPQPRVARALVAATLLGISIPYQVNFWNSLMPDFLVVIFGF